MIRILFIGLILKFIHDILLKTDEVKNIYMKAKESERMVKVHAGCK